MKRSVCVVLGMVAIAMISAGERTARAEEEMKEQKPLRHTELRCACELLDSATPEVAAVGAPAKLISLCKAVKDPEELRKLWGEGFISPDDVRGFTGRVSKLKAPKEFGPSKSLDSSSGPSQGASIQSNFLWSLTDVLVKHASEELNAWFFQRFRDKTCNTPKEEKANGFHVRSLLGNTCGVLMSSDLVSEIPGGTETLRVAAREDLDALLKTSVMELRRCMDAGGCESVGAREKLVQELLVLQYIGGVVEKLQRDRTIVDALQNPVLMKSQQGSDTVVAAYLDELTFIAQTLYDARSGTFTKPTVQDAPYVFSASLIDAQLAGYTGQDPFIFEGATQRVWPVALATIQAVGSVDARLQEARRAHDKGEKNQMVRAYASALNETIGLLRTWASLSSKGLTSGMDRTLMFAEDATKSIAQGEYGGAIVATFAFIDKAVKATPEKDAKGSAKKSAVSPGTTSGLSRDVKRTLAFVASVAQAKDAEAASAAIDSFVSPSGSFIKKRRSEDSYQLVNAYVGFNVGGERDGNTDAFAYAPWVPVGYEWGRGDRDWYLKIDSASIFIQGIDIGALAAYRVEKGGSSERPEVSFRQVVSPGLYVIFGFKNAPLSLGIGASYTPELRKITDENGVAKKANALRYGLTIGIDIPLFP